MFSRLVCKPAACRQLLTEYGPAVFRMVQRIVTRREDAEEVYQDVFVKALRGIEGPDERHLRGRRASQADVRRVD